LAYFVDPTGMIDPLWFSDGPYFLSEGDIVIKGGKKKKPRPHEVEEELYNTQYTRQISDRDDYARKPECPAGRSSSSES